MSFRHTMVKTKEYPQHHRMHLNFNLTHDDADATHRATMIPVLFNDDAISPPTIDTNPMHASFAEATEGSCAPESKVFSISCKLQMVLTKNAWNTDKLKNLKVQILPIAVAFEDIDAADELTSLTVGSILELQDEDTTNNTYPIYNGQKITTTTSQVVEAGASQLGLTTNTLLEHVTFDMDQLYQMLSYGSNRGKLKKCIGGIITRILSTGAYQGHGGVSTHRKGMGTGIVNMKINLPAKAKFMNKKTAFFLLIRIPPSGSEDQYGEAYDTTAIPHVTINYRSHFMEWNHAFNHARTG